MRKIGKVEVVQFFSSLNQSSLKIDKKRKKNQYKIQTVKLQSSIPSSDIFWVVTTLSLIVEDFTGTACQFTWFDSVKAHVELLAIFWMCKVWMSNDLSVGIVLVLVSWTCESILEFLLSFLASFTVGCSWPYTSA